MGSGVNLHALPDVGPLNGSRAHKPLPTSQPRKEETILRKFKNKSSLITRRAQSRRHDLIYTGKTFETLLSLSALVPVLRNDALARIQMVGLLS